ncbi:MAG: Holliday junction resolvase RuvX [bacterium]|nr:Holliday junction resolvase RuvX [bacterium]
MRLLGLDYGTKRVGVAIGDTQTRLALPYGVTSLFGIEKYLADLIEEEKIQIVVMGAPKNLRGEKTASYQAAAKLAQQLRTLPVKIIMEDERFTTKEVEKIIRGYGKAKKAVQKDAAAAAIILQGYLDKLSNL